MKIVLATSNAHKVEEVRDIMSDFDCEIISTKDAGCSMEGVIENGKTFMDNAIIKAKFVCEKTGLPAMADDSGLEVDFLNGEPGVYSARYMGEDTSYDLKNKNIIERVKDAKGSERSARFVCAIAVVFPSGEILTSFGTIEGEVAYEQKGKNGFGYDPIMYVKELGKTTAELSSEEKNAISHRGKALKQMKEKLLNMM